MTTFLHPMSSCMGGSPGSSRPSGNLALQPRHLANDAHQEANLQKQTKQAEFYSKGASCDKPVLNSFEPVFVWTLGSIYGNKAGFSTAKTLTENQEHILLKWMASWTKEQESTCDQRVLARGHQCLRFPKPPRKQYLVKSHSSNNRLQHWLKWIATLWHLQFQWMSVIWSPLPWQDRPEKSIKTKARRGSNRRSRWKHVIAANKANNKILGADASLSQIYGLKTFLLKWH